MNITVDVNKTDGNTIMKISGEIDAYTAPKLKETINQLTKEDGKNVVIDLTDVIYMDSTGLGVLVAAFKKIKTNGGSFILTGLSNRLQRLFTITGLSEIMDIKGESK
ncbi:STAS domain-containing protein [Caldibacillus lycopersici]|uniref:Anti-sigma factor antagonist n=1 Tax=Perspicuibacillus lycopersici TaxID=1325689 RepID=A0AAE3IX25_9BACI|nr:STAS domain-containing protein [Perspicuibacillus lycopersici]MCU9615168.1 STAS domain-containing protein [Perspicuibacillus lycopersici]